MSDLAGLDQILGGFPLLAFALECRASLLQDLLTASTAEGIHLGINALVLPHLLSADPRVTNFHASQDSG